MPVATPYGAFDNDADFQADAPKLVEFTRLKLGDPIMQVYMSSSQIYAAFEEACLEYSKIVNEYQAKSNLSQFLGFPTGSLSGSENKYISRSLELAKKLAEPFGEEANLNGQRTLFSASITLHQNQQEYDLQALLSASHGVTQRITVRDIYHYAPVSIYRFFGTNSTFNYLNSNFGFESFTPETVFYLLPLWEDVLRGMQLKLSNKIRRSNYSYELHNNVLKIFPVPADDIALWFTYNLPLDPTQSANNQDAATRSGVANLSNIPFGVLPYNKLNSIGKQWIRRYAYALAKEIEGQIRAKINSIPIPNGDLTLNGNELINDARADMDALRQELRELLDATTYEKLAEQEAAMAENLERTINRIPLGIYVG